MLDALYIGPVLGYLESFVSPGLADRLTATGPAEGAPNVAGNQMFDLLGVRYLLYPDETGNASPGLVGYPVPQGLPQQRRHGVREHARGAAAAFVAHDVDRVDDDAALQAYLKSGERPNFPDGATQVGNKDARSTAVVESDSVSAPSVEECSSSGDPAPTVVDRSPNSIKIDVQHVVRGTSRAERPVLPRLAGVRERGRRTHLRDRRPLRGVEVPAGHSVVEFSYNPSSFRLGIVVFLLAVGTILVVAVVTLYRSSRSRRRARRAFPEPTRPRPWPRVPTSGPTRRSTRCVTPARRHRESGGGLPRPRRRAQRGARERAHSLPPRSLNELRIVPEAPGAMERLTTPASR